MKAKKTTGAAGVEVFNKLFSYRLEPGGVSGIYGRRGENA